MANWPINIRFVIIENCPFPVPYPFFFRSWGGGGEVDTVVTCISTSSANIQCLKLDHQFVFEKPIISLLTLTVYFISSNNCILGRLLLATQDVFC